MTEPKPLSVEELDELRNCSCTTPWPDSTVRRLLATIDAQAETIRELREALEYIEQGQRTGTRTHPGEIVKEYEAVARAALAAADGGSDA